MTLNRRVLLVLVLFIASFGIYLRIQNLKFLEEKYLVGADPYRYFRQTRLIVEDGRLPNVDLNRNFPEGVDFAAKNTFLPKLLATPYMFINKVFPSISLHQAISLYPPIATGGALIFFFLLTYRLFGHFTALLAVLMLSSLPIFVQRTVAGYVDTDALVIFLFFAGMYLYVLSFDGNSVSRQLVFAGIAGGTLGLLGLVWQGVGLILLVFCGFQLLISWEKSYTKSDFYRFSCWLFPVLVLMLSFTPIYRKYPQAPFAVLALYIPLATWCIVLQFFFLQKSPKFVEFSRRFDLSVGLMTSLLLACTVVSMLTVYFRDFSWIEALIERSRYPFGKNGVMEFVGEMQPTTWGIWRKSYGMVGLTTLAGFCLLAYHGTSWLLKHTIIHAIIGGSGLMMIALRDTVPQLDIFGFFSVQSSLILLGNFCLVVSLASAARLRCRIDSIALDSRDKFHLILIAWFIIIWNLASSAVRFHLFLAPVAVMLTCYFFSWLLLRTVPILAHIRSQVLLVLIFFAWQALINGSDILSLGLKIVSLGKIASSFSGRVQLLLTLIVTTVLFGFFLQEKQSAKKTLFLIPRIVGAGSIVLLIWCNYAGLYTIESVERAVIWGARQGGASPNRIVRGACEWLEENVPQNAVIGADWEIGSAINELSRRATIVDEEQNVSRILAMSREFFCGTEEEALKFLRQYGVTHLLLGSEEISQLSLHSIGVEPSEEIFAVRLQPSAKYDPGAWHFTPQKEPFISEFRLDDIGCQQNECSIESISVPYTIENHPIATKPPELTVTRRNRWQRLFTVKEVIIGEQSWYFPQGELNGSIWCLGRMNGHVYQNYETLYLSSAVREWFLVKLFLGEHSDRFKLIYESEASDELLVKIWEVRDYADKGRLNAG